MTLNIVALVIAGLFLLTLIVVGLVVEARDGGWFRKYDKEYVSQMTKYAVAVADNTKSNDHDEVRRYMAIKSQIHMELELEQFYDDLRHVVHGDSRQETLVCPFSVFKGSYKPTWEKYADVRSSVKKRQELGFSDPHVGLDNRPMLSVSVFYRKHSLYGQNDELLTVYLEQKDYDKPYTIHYREPLETGTIKENFMSTTFPDFDSAMDRAKKTIRHTRADHEKKGNLP